MKRIRSSKLFHMAQCIHKYVEICWFNEKKQCWLYDFIKNYGWKISEIISLNLNEHFGLLTLWKMWIKYHSNDRIIILYNTNITYSRVLNCIVTINIIQHKSWYFISQRFFKSPYTSVLNLNWYVFNIFHYTLIFYNIMWSWSAP